MKRLKLSPFVYKVKGIRNWVLVDVMQQRIFQVEPDGDVEKFKQQLIENNLAHEMQGVIPTKYNLSISRPYRTDRMLRYLQIRITGECDEKCPSCGYCGCYKGEGRMTDEILNTLFRQIANIPVEQVIITGGNPFKETGRIIRIIGSIPAKQYIVVYKGNMPDVEKHLPRSESIHFRDTFQDVIPGTAKMKADAFTYFYQQHFNPCWGNSIAIDIDGSIKPCLWASQIIGKITNRSIKSFIDSNTFDPYWEISKDRIEICHECEYRYSCPIDCRVLASTGTGNLASRNSKCNYDPAEGK